MDRGSAASAVSDQLRERITEGRFPPGARVSEGALAQDLGVSRNTVREAFRLLMHDGLLVHRFNRGMFVPVMSSSDVRDVYRLRIIIEPGVIDSLTTWHRRQLAPLEVAVEEGKHAAAEEVWADVGTANMRFHRDLVGLAGSPRLDVTMNRLMAELRLIFGVIDDPRSLYEPYVRRNEELLVLLNEGRFAEGAAYLTDYLTASQAALLAAFEARSAPA